MRLGSASTLLLLLAATRASSSVPVTRVEKLADAIRIDI
jgi:hypothetical protein